MSACLLFDCDGTLVDSERLGHVGLVRKFQPLGIDLDADELMMRFKGWKLGRILEILESEHDLALPKDFVPGYRAIVSELFDAELKPIEGIEQALADLPQPKAVVSNGPPQKIKQALSLCGLSSYFGDNIYSAYDVGIWKPDPDIYRHAAAEMGYSPEQCSVIDDGNVGVEAGHLAGMTTYFYNRFRESCDFPNVISFESMHSLPELVRTNGSRPH